MRAGRIVGGRFVLAGKLPDSHCSLAAAVDRQAGRQAGSDGSMEDVMILSTGDARDNGCDDSSTCRFVYSDTYVDRSFQANILIQKKKGCAEERKKGVAV